MKIRAPRPRVVIAPMCVNIGRGAGTDEVEANLSRVESRARDLGAVVCFAEIDEDDVPDEHAILARTFTSGARGWRIVFRSSMEPVAVLTNRWVPGHRRLRKVFRGEARYSPARNVGNLVLTDAATGAQVGVITGHYMTGAKNARPGTVARPVLDRLTSGWVAMNLRHRTLIKFHHARGRDVVWAMDVNNPRMPKQHRHEVEGTRRPPDYVRAIPGRGRQVEVLDRGHIDMSIDTHRAEWARFRFSDKPRPPRARRYRKETP